MTNTINLDNDEIIDILIKNFYEFPTTDTKNLEWYQETTIPFNNYLVGDDIFIESIPDNPDFNNGTPREASYVDLLPGDFIDYSYNINDLNSCSIVDDSTGTIRLFRYLKLDPCPNQNPSKPKAWHKPNVTADSIQFNYKKKNDLSPYMYSIWTQDSFVTDDLIPFGSDGGNYIFNVKTGILLFVDYDNFELPNVEDKFKVNSQNVPVITFYKYIGTKGIKNLTPIIDNLNLSLDTLTVSNELIVLGDTSLNTLIANDVSFTTLDVYNILTVSNELIVLGDTSLNTLIANDVSFTTLDVYNTLTVSNELNVNTIKSYNKDLSIVDSFFNTYTNILDLTDFSDIIYSTTGSAKTSINETLNYFFEILIGNYSINGGNNNIFDLHIIINNLDVSFNDIKNKFEEDIIKIYNNESNINDLSINLTDLSINLNNKITDLNDNLTDLSINLNDKITDLNDNLTDLSRNLNDKITDLNDNIRDLIEISYNNFDTPNPNIYNILAYDTLINDCKNSIYLDISNNKNNNVLINVNINYLCSYGYRERIKIFLFKDDQNNPINGEDHKLLESSFLGTEMATIYQGNYSCSYLDNNHFHNSTTRYYIKFQLENYSGHGNGQGIIHINTSTCLSAINFNI